MLRLVAAYRWEFWLLVVAPLAVSLAPALLMPSTPTIFPELSDWERGLALRGVAQLVGVALLLIALFRLRAQGRKFVALVCGYLIAGACANAAVTFAVASDAINAPRIMLWTAEGLLLFPLLIWFTRQASRMSMAHAFFLLLVSRGHALWPSGDSWLPGSEAATIGAILVLAASAYALLLLQVWMLGNFDARGAGFRRRAVTALFALEVVGYGVNFLVGHSVVAGIRITAFASIFALVYLLRVRQPAPQQESA